MFFWSVVVEEVSRTRDNFPDKSLSLKVDIHSIKFYTFTLVRLIIDFI